jgi:CHAT domain-containing protein
MMVAAGCRRAGEEPAALFAAAYADYVHGSLDLAREKAERARRSVATGGRGQALWESKFLLLEAEVLLKLNHPAEALGLLTGEHAMPPGGDPAVKWTLLCSQAHYYLGQMQDADRELRAARRLAETAHSALMGDVLAAEGLVELDAGHLERAAEDFTQSLAIAREHGDSLLQASDLVNSSYVSLQSGHYDEAVASAQRAVAFARNIRARKQLQRGLGNLGSAYDDLGDFEAALGNFQEAERQAHDLGMTGSRVIWLQDAGLAAYQLGRLDEARRYDEEALEVASTLPAGKATDQIANIEANLALLLCAQGRYDQAKAFSDRAEFAARASTDDQVIAYPIFLQGLIAARQGRAEAERLLEDARKRTPDPETRMEIENTLANFYAGRHQAAQAELWYRRSIETFERNRASVHEETLRMSSFAYGDAVYRDYADFLIAARRPDEALAVLDRSRARTLDEGLGVASGASNPVRAGAPDVRAVARRLGATLLFYSLGPQASHLWAVTDRETRLFTLPARKDIKALLAEHNQAIQRSLDPLRTQDRAAAALYEALVRPAAALLRADPKVYVIPDGDLHALNFETLLAPGAEGPHYWIEDATVTMSSSIRILARPTAQTAAAAPRDLLLIGDPLPSGGGFEALPNAAAEIERIQAHFTDRDRIVLTRAHAVPAAYTSSAPDQFRYIHFVAHGVASRLSPLDSAVVLSPAVPNAADFKLYARDVVQHPLNADLVTISACNGSGLRTYAGEGLVGLAWAFLRAGSHNVIGALWSADDAATPQLMDRLYAELAAGHSPDAALRTAKLEILHSTGVYRKPLYWGVFQLYAGA